MTTLHQNFKHGRRTGLSLTELLVVIAVLGIISALAIPQVSSIREAAREATAIQNAKNIASISEALSALGVAHVIPESMGGVEATGRLIREGVIVPEGPMVGQRFTISGISDEEIERAAEYLQIEYHDFNLRLHFEAPEETGLFLPVSVDVMMCFAESLSMRTLELLIGL